MDAIQAQVTVMPVTDMSITYAVTILGPVYLAPRLYKISMQQLLTRCRQPKDEARVIGEILSECIIRDYNNEVEAQPIMDMFENPGLYKTLYRIDWHINKLETVEGTGLEPVTPGSSDRRSTN